MLAVQMMVEEVTHGRVVSWWTEGTVIEGWWEVSGALGGCIVMVLEIGSSIWFGCVHTTGMRVSKAT